MSSFARQHDIDPEKVYFTAYSLVLRVLCQEPEILTGFGATCTDPSSRVHLPIRVRTAKSATKLDLARTLSVQIDECRRHSMSPAAICEAAGVRDEDGALFCTSFDYRKNSPELPARIGTEPTLFDVEVTEDAGDVRVGLTYREDCFTQEQARYALAIYETVLRSFTSSAETPFTFRDYVDSEELQRNIHDFNATQAPWDPARLQHHAFEQVARRSPERTALIFGEQIVTYGELNARANQLARLLAGHDNFRTGTNVGIIAERNPSAIIAMLAIVKTGCTYVPIDPTYPVERHIYIISNAGIKVVLGDKPYAHVHEAGADLLLIEDARLAEMSSADVVSPAQPGDLAYIIYTSGSTGRPKGVMIEHRSIVNLVDCISQDYGLSEDDRFVLLSSFCFDLSVYDIFGALSLGASLLLVPPEHIADAFAFAKTIEEKEITFWNSVPSTMGLLVEVLASMEEAHRLDSLKTVFMSGDWIPLDLPDSIRRFCPNAQVVSLGGATEGTVWSNHYRIGHVARHWKSIPYGYPLRNNFFYVLDEQGQPVPRDVVGELHIGGLGVARGYISDPEKTARAFITNPFTDELGGRLYRTGDLGRLTLQGHLEILGRMDGQVKVRGYRIELGEIEHALETHDSVFRAVVAAVATEDARRKELVADVVPDNAQSLDKVALREHLKALLPAYMVPFFYVTIEALPLSENGKVDRKRLPHPKSATNEGRAPSSEVEREVHEICQRLFGTSDISITATLAELGLSSLVAIRMIAAFEKTFGVGISVAHLISLVSLEGIARHIAERLSGDAHAEDERAEAQQEPGSSRLGLTGLQMSYFLGETDLFPLGNSIAHVYREFRITEAVCVGLDGAVNKLIAAHPMLRACISPQGEWRFLDQVPEYHAKVIDWRGLSSAESDAMLELQRKLIRENGLGTSTWPLFDFTVIRLSNGDALLHCRIDLVLLDGLSITTFFGELDRLITAPNAEARAARATYADYRRALGRFTSEHRYLESKRYWASKLDTLPDAPSLPMVKRLRDSRTSNLTTKVARVSAADWRRLNELAGSFKVGPGILVYSVFAHVLGQWSHDERFTVNILYYNREPLVEGVTDILGNFSSTLLFGTELRPGEAFVNCALRLQRQQTHELQHAIYDGVDVLNERNRVRRNVGPSMPVVFTSLLGLEEAKGSGAITEVVMGVQTPQVILDCLVREIDGQLVLLWSVQEDLFAPHLIDTMLAAMKGALEGLSEGGARFHEALRLPSYQGVTNGEARDEDARLVVEEARVDVDRLRRPEQQSRPSRRGFEAPSTPIEIAIHRIWCELLGVTNISVNDNLFDLGCHSLLAVRFVAKVKSLYKLDIPLSALFSDGTIRSVARVIENLTKTSEDRNLLLFQPAGKREPFYCVHAVGGHVLNYHELANRLRGTQRPFFAIQAHGIDDGESVIDSIPEMAKKYLEMLRRVQPRGPYFMGGWSFGGIVAYEMARQLELRGEPVAAVIMLDTWAPLFYSMPLDSESAMFRLFVRDLAASLRQNERFAARSLVPDQDMNSAQLVLELRALGVLGPEQDERAIDTLFRVYSANMKAMAQYTILPVRSRVVLIQAKNRPYNFDHYRVIPQNALGWRDFINPEVIEVKGDHYSILTGRHVGEVSDILVEILSRDFVSDVVPAMQHGSSLGLRLET